MIRHDSVTWNRFRNFLTKNSTSVTVKLGTLSPLLWLFHLWIFFLFRWRNHQTVHLRLSSYKEATHLKLQYDKKFISKYSHVFHFSLIQNNNNLLLVLHETHLWSLPGMMTSLCLSLPHLPPDFPLLVSMEVIMCELFKFLLCKTAHRNLEERG